MSYAVGDLKQAIRYLERQTGKSHLSLGVGRQGIVDIVKDFQNFMQSDEFKHLSYFAKLQSLDIAVWYPETIDESRGMFPIRFNQDGFYCERPKVDWEERRRQSYTSGYDYELLAISIRESDADFVDVVYLLREEIADEIEEIRERSARATVYQD